MKEILSQYGDLCLIWFDVPCTIKKEQCLELKEMVRKRQPGCFGIEGKSAPAPHTTRTNLAPLSPADYRYVFDGVDSRHGS